MIIRDFLKTLNYLSENLIIKNIDLSDYGSYKGGYEDFYIGSNYNNNSKITVKEIKEFFNEKVIGKTFWDYKGGDFLINEYITLKFGCQEEVDNVDGLIIDEDGIKIKVQKVLYY